MTSQVLALDPSVASLVEELVGAGALPHWPETHQGWFGLRGGSSRRIGVYVRSHWATVLLQPEMAEAAVAGGRVRVERKAASTWYVRFGEDALSSPDGFSEGLRFARLALELDPAVSADGLTTTETPSKGDSARPVSPLPGPSGLRDPAEARAGWEHLARSEGVHLDLVGGKNWAWARVGMGPFPARLVLDENGHEVILEVVVGYATQTSRIEEIASSIPLPTPEVSYSLSPQAAVSFRYAAPLGAINADEGYRMLTTAVWYACLFSWSLYDDLAGGTQQLLRDAGLNLETGFTEPIKFLSTGAWRFEPWESETPAATAGRPKPTVAFPLVPVMPWTAEPANTHLNALALSVARCPEVDSARRDPAHPCRMIVGLQSPNPDKWQVPEPWAGNLDSARIAFISSNPSISQAREGEDPDSEEDYPRGYWPDEQVADFVVNRFAHGWATQEGRFLRRDGTYSSSTVQFWVRTRNRATELLERDADPAVDYVMTEVVHCKSRDESG